MTSSEVAVRARQFYQQGLGFYQRGELIEATEALRLAVRTVPDHVDARLQLGRVLQRRGKPDEALRVIDAGLARQTLSTDRRIKLLQEAASCCASLNRYELARHYLEQALELGRVTDVHLLNQVAAVCCKGGEFETGFDYFLKAAAE